ncbi:unnamed protein product [Ilex paraguariensis]|uniref:Uncharacterized protein n=1 Tax=Ilex paraguariensis TaxID=185542 RepID=A0ABC8TAD8_9AQUA
MFEAVVELYVIPVLGCGICWPVEDFSDLLRTSATLVDSDGPVLSIVCARLVISVTPVLASAELFKQESEFLIYGNGREKPPTGFMFDKQQMNGLYFNQSPAKVPLQSKPCALS